jgi:hypothetical protein
MTETTPNPRTELLRKSAILQLKLVVDGIRDAALIPLSLLATLIGMMRGGADAESEFQRVIKLGRRSERWINLFGHQPPLRHSHPGGSLDHLLNRVEEVVMEQYRKGQSEEEARAAINKVLQEEAPAANPGSTGQPDKK